MAEDPSTVPLFHAQLEPAAPLTLLTHEIQQALYPTTPGTPSTPPSTRTPTDENVMAKTTTTSTSPSGPPPSLHAPSSAASSSTAATGPVPLDSPLRTTPIHASTPSIKVPATALTSSPNTNPVTLQPFTDAELAKYGFEKLRAQIWPAAGRGDGAGVGLGYGAGTTADLVTGALPLGLGLGASAGASGREKEELARIRQETAAALRQKLDERDSRVREIEREMADKEKTREVERKVFRKKLAGRAGDG